MALCFSATVIGMPQWFSAYVCNFSVGVCVPHKTNMEQQRLQILHKTDCFQADTLAPETVRRTKRRQAGTLGTQNQCTRGSHTWHDHGHIDAWQQRGKKHNMQQLRSQPVKQLHKLRHRHMECHGLIFGLKQSSEKFILQIFEILKKWAWFSRNKRGCRASSPQSVAPRGANQAFSSWNIQSVLARASSL